MNILKDFFNYVVIKGFSSKEKLIPHLKYTQWKKALLKKILKCYPCSEELNAFIAAQTEEATWQVVLRNMRWLTERSIDPGPIPPSVTQCDGYLYLRGYKHPLPKGFTHCGGHLFLGGYNHPLPKGFTHCGGSLDLIGYNHPLPKGFKEKESSSRSGMSDESPE